MEQFACDSCNKTYTKRQLLNAIGTYQPVKTDTTGAGEATYVKGDGVFKCECGQEISVEHAHWDFPVGVKQNINEDEQFSVHGANRLQ